MLRAGPLIIAKMNATITPLSVQQRLAQSPKIVLFDATCVLCSAWTGFLMPRDPQGHMQLVSVQSPLGQQLLAHFGFPTDHFDTMLYIEHGIVYTESDAFFNIVAQLPAPWCWLPVFRIIPARLRNMLYRLIARNRYRWFGQYEQCQIPPADHTQRFLHD
jgi:predicted DCC family thiol-disulfide oxidoreductase YuxK